MLGNQKKGIPQIAEDNNEAGEREIRIGKHEQRRCWASIAVYKLPSNRHDCLHREARASPHEVGRGW
jgi:hypothetical protein